MRTPLQVTFDAQFGRDIEWIRYEFKPSAMGTREAVFLPIKVVAPNLESAGTEFCEVTLLIRASDIYMLGWSNAHGTFHLADCPVATAETKLRFSSHYSELGFRKGKPLSAYAGAPVSKFRLCSAVKRLASVASLAEANTCREEVGLMAFSVPESIRQDVVAGLMESLFAHRRHEVSRSLLREFNSNWQDNTQAGDPYVEIPWMQGNG
jgi:hypothetical protein